MTKPSKLRVVLDANVILQSIWKHDLDGSPPAFQTALLMSEFWAFMAEPIAEEVERNLREKPRGNYEKQIDLWRTEYLPKISVIHLRSNAYSTDPRIQNLLKRDRSDVPTAQLVLFLNPDCFFTQDNDFQDFDRHGNSGEISAAFRDSIAINREINAVWMFQSAGITVSSEIWKAFRRLPPIIQALLGGATIGALLVVGPSLQQKLIDGLRNPNIQEFIRSRGTKIQERMNQLDHATKYLDENLPPKPPAMGVHDHLIEIFSVIDTPLLIEEIHWRLLARGYQPKGPTSQHYVLSVLRKHAIFTQDENGAWHLTPESPNMKSIIHSQQESIRRQSYIGK